MPRISSFFEHRDLKSIEARVLRHKALADLRSRCREFGINSPKIKETILRPPGVANRRRAEMPFRVELHVEIPDRTESAMIVL